METKTRARTIWACDRPTPTAPRHRLHRAVFLDRDGTLIVDKPYNADPAAIELLPGVREALALLDSAGYQLIVVTNQSGIARGFYGLAEVERMHERLDELLRPIGQPIRGYYVCPHHCEGSVIAYARPCPSRKPGPGMLLRAAEDWAIDLRRSWMIGDLATDVQAGRAAGCRPIQVRGQGPSGGAIRVGTITEAAQQVIARDAVARHWAMEGLRAAHRG